MKKILFLTMFFVFSSCSLKYSETINVEDTVPEFIFEDTTITRLENKKKTVQVSADVLEQYKDSSETYAKNVTFSAFNDDGEVQAEGNCGYLFANTDAELYEMYDNIKLENKDDNTSFYANVLRWNSKTEQLTSGRGNMVRIETDDTVIHGSGFSASGVSKSFAFTGTVTGEIKTEDEGEEELE